VSSLFGLKIELLDKHPDTGVLSMERTEIRVSGYGGQGVIMAGYIIGKGASLFEGLEATLTQAFGPEARGSACSAQVIVHDEKILYPYIRNPHILISMSQEAYTKFEPEMDPNGILLIDEDLVKPDPPRGKIKMYAVPATRLAEELGRKIVLNIVMVGFFASICSHVVKPKSMREAVEASVPAGTEALNLKAFDTGYEYGENLKKENPAAKPKAKAKPAPKPQPKPKKKTKASA
jgi:2-oxoglutarate ferredoxin oxidoreductase subunit gamma